MSRGFDWESTAGVHWSKSEKDFMCGAPTTATRSLLAHDFVGSDTFKNLLIELDQRGYDLTTLRFSVKKHSTHIPVEDLYRQFINAKELLEPMRTIKLESIKKTLEKQEKQSTEFYKEICRTISF